MDLQKTGTWNERAGCERSNCQLSAPPCEMVHSADGKGRVSDMEGDQVMSCLVPETCGVPSSMTVIIGLRFTVVLNERK